MSKKSLYRQCFRKDSNLVLKDRADSVKNGVYTSAPTFTKPPVTQAS